MRFPARFEGPPGTVNGGMAVGALACASLAAAGRAGVAHPAVTRITARLHRAVRHTVDLSATVSPDGSAWDAALADGDGAMVTARVETASLARAPMPGDVLAAPPEDLTALLRDMARVTEPASPPFFDETGDHPIPNCFSCGPANDRGLHCYPRFAADGVTWASWRPDGAFIDPPGALAASVVAAALDCSSGVCLPREQQIELLDNDQFYLLGSFDVRYLRVPPPGAAYHVVAHAGRREGRKFFGASALFDDAGTPYATADAIWIIVAMTRTQAFGPAASS